ncbi:MAG: glycosyltransferase [Cyclobacteriaceae bacterium]|nr:glycosyltransferase [Cyclobacteriaceae bacterium]
MNSPQVTVLMSVYNGMPYLSVAIESILNQTFQDVELIIIEDCSTDDSLEYLKSLRDHRIRLETNKVNLGMAASLNKGLLMAKGKYIARLDADDVALPNRIKTQFEFLELHPNIEFCGSHAQVIDQNDAPLFIWKRTLTPLEIRWKILFKNPFIHSSVMFRRNTVVDNGITYQNLSGTDDYKFWSDLLKFGEGSNLDQVLIQYRLHDKSMTKYNSTYMKAAHVHVALYNQSFLLRRTLSFSDCEKLILAWQKNGHTFRSANLYFKLLKNLCQANRHNPEIESLCKNCGKSLLNLLSSKHIKLIFYIRLLLLRIQFR